MWMASLYTLYFYMQFVKDKKVCFQLGRKRGSAGIRKRQRIIMSPSNTLKINFVYIMVSITLILWPKTYMPLSQKKKGFILQFILPNNSPSLRKFRAETQGSNLEAEVDTETREECCLLVAPQGLISLLSYNTQLRGVTSYSELGPPPTPIISQENVPLSCPPT